MKRLAYLLLVFTLLSVVAVEAAQSPFLVQFVPVNNNVMPGEEVVYNVTVTNNQDISDFFSVYSTDLNWLVDTNPALKEVAAGESKSTVVTLYPKSSVQQGPQGALLIVKSRNTREQINDQLTLFVKNPDLVGLQYKPSVALTARVPTTVDPREPLPVELYVRNRNSLNISKLDVVIESELFSKEVSMVLFGLEEKNNKYLIDLDRLTNPGSYEVVVRLTYNDETITESEQTFEVLGYDEVTRSLETSKSFFKYYDTYLVTNKGNVPKMINIHSETNWLKSVFTSTLPRAEKGNVNGESVYQWTVNIGPEEEITVTKVENYRVLVILFVLIILSIVAYFMFRSPVVVWKEALVVEPEKEGDGVSELKIRLYVKNRARDPIHNVRIFDQVTRIAEIVEEDGLGTLAPTKVVKNKHHGTLAKWEIDVLEPFEERIISYKVKLSINLVGDIFLPNLQVIFESRYGGERSVHSNEVTVHREK